MVLLLSVVSGGRGGVDVGVGDVGSGGMYRCMSVVHIRGCGIVSRCVCVFFFFFVRM